MNKKEVIKLIGKDRWKEFNEWMRGQTVGINADSTTDYYKWDVERFVEGMSPMW